MRQTNDGIQLWFEWCVYYFEDSAIDTGYASVHCSVVHARYTQNMPIYVHGCNIRVI